MIRYLTGIVLAISLFFSCGKDDDTLRQETADYLLGEWDAVLYINYNQSATFDTFFTDRMLHFVDDTLCTTSYKNLFHYSFTYELLCDQDLGVCNIYRKRAAGGVTTLINGRIQIFDDDHFSIHGLGDALNPADEVCTATPTTTLEYFDNLEFGDPLDCPVLVATRR